MRTSWKRSPEWRGRRSGDPKSLEYLIYLSHKYGVDPNELLNSFIKAEKKNTSICGPLEIILRKRGKDHAIFLVTRKSEIVAQIRMRNGLWKNPEKLKKFYSKLIEVFPPIKKLNEPPSSVKELRKGMKNFDLRVKVTEKSEVRMHYSRYHDNPVHLCVATVADPSGSIRLPLWNEQIDAVSVGDEIEIKKAYVTAFQGVLQIVPSRKKGELVVLKPSKPSYIK